MTVANNKCFRQIYNYITTLKKRVARKQSTTRRLNFIDKKRVQTVTAPERCGIIKLVESTIYRRPANCDEHPSGQ
jgi:hypothetical protein